MNFSPKLKPLYRGTVINKLAFEQLEARQLLAADLLANSPTEYLDWQGESVGVYQGKWFAKATSNQYQGDILLPRFAHGTDYRFHEIAYRVGKPTDNDGIYAFDFADLIPATTAINVLSSIPGLSQIEPDFVVREQVLIPSQVSSSASSTLRAMVTAESEGTPLVVSSVTPSPGDIILTSNTVLQLNFNAPVLASSIATTDLTVNVGAVSSFTIIDAQTIQFVLSGISAEGQLSISTASGAFVGIDGQLSAAFSASFVVDVDTLNYSGFFSAYNRLNELLSFQSTFTGSINSAGDEDRYMLDLIAGQSIGVELTMAAAGSTSVSLISPQGVTIYSSSINPTSNSFINGFVPTTGTYTLLISGNATPHPATYNARISLNAELELETSRGSNNSRTTAYPISLLEMSSGANHRRNAVYGSIVSASDEDWYSFQLAAGDRITLAGGKLGFPNVDVQLISADGTVLASGVAADEGSFIQDYQVAATGTYYAKVTGGVETYLLGILQGAVVSQEPNDTAATAQPLTQSWVAYGFVGNFIPGGGRTEDHFTFAPSVGATLNIDLQKPAITSGEIINLLQARVDLISPSGAVVASNGFGSFAYQVNQVGTYRARVYWSGGFWGLYQLSIQSSTPRLVPAVTEIVPSDGSTDVGLGKQLQLKFDRPVQAGTGTIEFREYNSDNLLSSIDIRDLRVSFVGDRVFIDAAELLLPQTSYYVLISADAIQSISGVSFAGISSKDLWNFTTTTQHDFGDAPSPYRVMYDENGARHRMASGPILGTGRDAEVDGWPSQNANQDDNFGDDEDGVILGSMRAGLANASVTIAVTTTGPAYIDGWIDFNQDGSWNGPDERILASAAVQNGQNILSFNVPARAAYGMTYARFRISSQGGLGPQGEALDGEVEDYQVFIDAPLGTNDVFTPQNGIFTTQNFNEEHHVADMDGDGDMDIVLGAGDNFRMNWLRNDAGVFTPRLVHLDANATQVFSISDLDGDGDKDIVALNSGLLKWFENDGLGVFAPNIISLPTEIASGDHLLIVDANGDGRTDIAAIASNLPVNLYTQNVNGTYTSTTSTVAFGAVVEADAGDIDGDGDIDIVAGGSWLENVNGTFTPRSITFDVFNSVELADLDLDGDLDIATTYFSSLELFLNNGSGVFTQQLAPSSISVASIAIADLDGDGDFDIATGNTSSFAPSIVWFENLGALQFFVRSVGNGFDGGFTQSLDVVDLDSDGDLDVTAIDASGDLLWYRNESSTTNVLQLAVDSSFINENAGTITGTITRTFASSTQFGMLVNLSSSSGDLLVPATVGIAPGATSAQFTITVVDNAVLDGLRTGTIQATFNGYSNDSVSIIVNDYETLTINLGATTISEGSGQVTATVSRSNISDLSQPLQVFLFSDDAGRARTPRSVTIPAGQSTSRPFAIDIVDDTSLSVLSQVGITAVSSGYVDGTASLTITENDLAPRVTDVIIASSTWSRSFIDAVDGIGAAGNGLGYSLAGAHQLRNVPWIGVNKIYIKFDQAISITEADVTINGINVASYAKNIQYGVDGANVVTITLAQSVENDVLQLSLSNSVIGNNGLILDGEWNDGVSTISGNGTPGGTFSMRMDFLPGDVDDSGGVNLGGDVLMVFAANDTVVTTFEQAYLDVNGSGGINLGDDVLAIFARNDAILPSPPPSNLRMAVANDFVMNMLGEGESLWDDF